MHTRPRRAARLVAGSVAALVLLAAAPLVGTASAADPLPPLADPTGAGRFCAAAPSSNPFSDLGEESAATREVILCLVATGLTSGTTPTTYSPGGTVTRRQMALFIKRTADLFAELERTSPGLAELPAYDGDPDYPDVEDEDRAFQEAIGQLTQAGVVGGFPDATFRPNVPVTRRQMAAFVNRLQEFLTGDAYTADGDYFDDDEGDPGEDNLNALAGVGIFQGDGRGNVNPGDQLTRRQMANILLRNAQVNLVANLIDRPFTADDGVDLEPAAGATIEFVEDVDATTPDDDRTYTASTLPASTGGYRVTIFDSDNVSESGGDHAFAEGGEDGLARAGTVAARIVSVNGNVLETPANSVGAVQPVNGTITFTIDGDGTESVTPVIHTDGGENTRLELDDDGHPIEPYGVGGAVQYIPAEAGDNSSVSGDVVLDGGTFAVVETVSGPVTVYFVNGDTYRVGSAPPFETVPAATFKEVLSAGDALRTCQSNLGLPNFYAEGGPNEYCLDDVAPANPTDLEVLPAAPRDRARELTWTGADPAESYRVYRNDEPCADTVVSELVRIATVPATPTRYTDTGLTPGTAYCYVVTTVHDDDESTLEIGTGAAGDDNTAAGTTAGVIEAPRITGAALTTDEPLTGAATTGDVFTLSFDEPMAPDTVDGATFSVTDGDDGDTTTIECDGDSPVVLDDGVMLAECVLDDGADASVDDDTLTITLREDGDDANAQGGNDDLIEYPLTITATTGLQDADDGEAIDLGRSSDMRIG